MEKNIWTGIEPANVELPIQVINEYANSFNETFEGKMTMTVKSERVRGQVPEPSKYN